jgi:hypothetical protein
MVAIAAWLNLSRELVGEKFQSNLAVQAFVPRLIHDPHSTPAQLSFDAVMRDRAIGHGNKPRNEDRRCKPRKCYHALPEAGGLG